VRQYLRINVLRLLFIALVPLMLLTRPHWPEGSGVLRLLQMTGVILIFAAILGRFWSILYIGACKNRMIVEVGPYSICRNPLYLFSTIGAVGFGLLLGSILLAVLFGAVFASVLYVTARREEAYLRSAFGPVHDRYVARVPRFWPNPRLFTTPETVEVSVPHLRANLKDALVFLALLPLVELVGMLQRWVPLPAVAIW
jgi:protein-S-isoprenylcysteine O-methyltransferase Ste14